MSNSETLLRALCEYILISHCCCQCTFNRSLRDKARAIKEKKEIENACLKCDGTGDGYGGIGGDTQCLDCGGTGKRSK